jgi:hypothetical protein
MRQRRRHRLGDPRRCRPAQSPRLPARDNIALMPLPPTAPELNPVDPSAALRASRAFDALRSRHLGESARQPARPWRLEQLRGDHRGVLRRPGTPLWPNPSSWPQLEPEIGRRSRVKAVDFAVVQAVCRVGLGAAAAAQAHFQAHWRHRKSEVFPDTFRSAHPFDVEIPVEHRE